MTTFHSEVRPMQDDAAMAKLYGLTIRPHETVTMFLQRIERHRKQLAESLKTPSEVR